MKEEIIEVRFKLIGEIKVELFMTNLKSWIDNANDQLLDPAEIPETGRIEYEVINHGW